MLNLIENNTFLVYLIYFASLVSVCVARCGVENKKFCYDYIDFLR